MSVIGSNILAGASGQGGGYNLTKSLRFRKSANGYLSRTMNATSTTYTVSAWVKRGLLSGYQYIFASGPNTASNDKGIAFDTSTNQIYAFNGSTQALSSAVFRDPSAWYHVVMSVNSGTATVYVNNINTGISQTSMSLGTYGRIGRFNDSSSANDFDGYMAEFNLIDGQALTPSSFGETSTTTGVWIPKKYTGTYGTNGFYLPFTDTTSTSTLGTDFSGNSNTWTVNGISLTSGSTYDSMNDVPTLTSATTANYCTWNPLALGTNVTTTNGNLTAQNTVSESNHRMVKSTFGLTTGKWYWELNVNNSANVDIVGLTTTVSGLGALSGYAGDIGYGYNTSSGAYYANTGWTTNGTPSAFPTSGVVNIAYDADAGKIWFGSNGTWFNSGNPATGSNAAATYSGTAYTFVPALSVYANTGSWNINCGQRPFAYTPPTGFKALNTFNLPTPTIGATASTTANKYFNPVIWTGNGSNPRAITGVGFQPDMVWAKARSQGYSHGLYDAVRGAGGNKRLYPNEAYPENGIVGAEGTAFGSLTSFDSDGFSVNAGTTSNIWFNANNETYVAWNWKANGTGVTNTAGSITSTVSANTTAGFSIVTYTGNGSSPVTIGHGLGVTPAMIILKDRDAISSWMVKHQNMSSNTNIFLEGTGGEVTPGNGYIQNLTSSTTFGVINGGSGVANVNTTSNKYVAYCFAQVAGYSAFGSYTGNNASDGTFVYLGFRPKFIMIKSTSNGTEWVMVDSTRSTYNLVDTSLYANRAYSESTIGTVDDIDFLSNGFKLRNNTGYVNSSQTYIYMAVAENPFKYANAR